MSQEFRRATADISHLCSTVSENAKAAGWKEPKTCSLTCLVGDAGLRLGAKLLSTQASPSSAFFTEWSLGSKGKHLRQYQEKAASFLWPSLGSRIESLPLLCVGWSSLSLTQFHSEETQVPPFSGKTGKSHYDKRLWGDIYVFTQPWLETQPATMTLVNSDYRHATQ